MNGPAMVLAATAAILPLLGPWAGWMQQASVKTGAAVAGSLLAALVYFALHWRRRMHVRWHGMLWIWLMLAGAAASSMPWHPVQAGAEAVRWSMVALLGFLVLNNASREHFVWLCKGVHMGAVLSGVLGALQVWSTIEVPWLAPEWRPSGTFLDGSQLAHYLLLTLPFSLYLLLRAHMGCRLVMACVLALSIALNVCMIVLAGDGVVALAALAMLPLAAWATLRHTRRGATLKYVEMSTGWLDFCVLAGALALLMFIPTVQRGPATTVPAAPQTGWEVLSSHAHALRALPPVATRADLRLIEVHAPWGVGAGRWRAEVAGVQAPDVGVPPAPVDAVRLVAEYGVVGALAMAALMVYLLVSVWRTRWIARVSAGETSLRLAAIASLGMALLWMCSGARMLGAPGLYLLALALGVLGASDFRMVLGGVLGARPLLWGPAHARVACVAVVVLALALMWPASQALRAQRAYLEAIELSNRGVREALPWELQEKMARRARDGVALDASYAGWVVPLAQDLLGRSRWTDAAVLYEAALGLLPNDRAVLAGGARAYAAVGDLPRSRALLERALARWPDDPGLRSTQVMLEARAGQPQLALALARRALGEGLYDMNLVDHAVALAQAQGEFALAQQCLELHMRHWPAMRAQTMVRIGEMHLRHMADQPGALHWYRQALASAPVRAHSQLILQIPQSLWHELAPSTEGNESETEAEAPVALSREP